MTENIDKNNVFSRYAIFFKKFIEPSDLKISRNQLILRAFLFYPKESPNKRKTKLASMMSEK